MHAFYDDHDPATYVGRPYYVDEQYTYCADTGLAAHCRKLIRERRARDAARRAAYEAEQMPRTQHAPGRAA